MNTENPVSTKQNRWEDWNPKPISCICTEHEPTKPSKPGSVGFVGAAPAKNTEMRPSSSDVARATTLVNQAGVRLMRLASASTIGVWSDLDGPEIRQALRTLELDRLPMKFLNGDGIPPQYKVRNIPERVSGVLWEQWQRAAINLEKRT